MFLQGGGRPHMCFHTNTLFKARYFTDFKRDVASVLGAMASSSKLGGADETVSGFGGSACAGLVDDGTSGKGYYRHVAVLCANPARDGHRQNQEELSWTLLCADMC